MKDIERIKNKHKKLMSNACKKLALKKETTDAMLEIIDCISDATQYAVDSINENIEKEVKEGADYLKKELQKDLFKILTGKDDE